MSSIGIITNPFSKLNKKDPSRTKLLGYILGEQGRLELTRSLDELQRAAYKFKASNIGTLAINGGDGTVARTLTAFISAYGNDPLPKVALLRGGTMNVLASNLRIYGSPESLLCRYLEALSQEGTKLNTKKLRCLNIEGNYGFLFADGICVNVLEEFYKNKGNALTVGILVAKLCLSSIFKGSMYKRLIKPRTLQYSLNDQTIDSVISGCGNLASTIERMPMGPRLFPYAKKTEEQFQYLLVKSKPEQLIWNLLPILINTQLGETKHKISGLCERISFKGKEEKFPYSLDGEIYSAESNSLSIRLGPGIDFLIP